MKRFIFGLIVLCLSVATGWAEPRHELGPEWAKRYLSEAFSGKAESYKPEEGYVPNKETAITIAVTVLGPIYGKDKIEAESPFFAYLVDGYWIIKGSLPEGWKGGTAVVVISKTSGEIIHLTHYM
jgi:hypothetical protein